MRKRFKQIEKENQEIVNEFLKRPNILEEDVHSNEVAKELLKKVILFERENQKLKDDARFYEQTLLDKQKSQQDQVQLLYALALEANTPKSAPSGQTAGLPSS